MRDAVFSRETLHPLLAAAPAVCFSLAALFFTSDVFAASRPGALLVVLVFAAAAVELIVGALLRKARAKPIQRLREFILLLATAYLLLAIVRPGPFSERFVADATLLLHVATVAVAWLLTLRFHSGFRAREELLQAVRGKRGEQLRREMRQTQGFATSIITDMRRVRSGAAFFLVLLALALIAARLHDSQLSGTTVAWSVLYATLSIVLIALVKLFEEEFAFYADGLPLATRYFRKRAVQLAALTLFAALVAFLLSSERAALSLEFLRPLGAWLANLFSGSSTAQIQMPPSPLASRPPAYWFELAQRLELSRPSPFWTSFFELLEKIVLAILALAGVAFLVAPFVTRTFRRAVKSMNPWAAIRARLIRAVVALWQLYRFIRLKMRGGKRKRRLTVEELPEERTHVRRGSGGNRFHRARKQLQSATLLKEYRRVLEWCAEHDLDRRHFETVREHGKNVSGRYPGLQEALQVVVDVVERAVFSPEIVSAERRKRFREAVEEVCGRP